MQTRDTLPSWRALKNHVTEIKDQSISNMFKQNPLRFEQFSIELPTFLFDYSKNLITDTTMKRLLELAIECDVTGWRQKMFNGEKINTTEERAVLHTALRNLSQTDLFLDGENINQAVENTLNQIKAFSHDVRQGHWRGFTGKRITDVVNIGVGGSNLGPQMVTEALKQYSDQTVTTHYVSNVDATQIADVLRPLNPETVLFIVSSKTFTTAETMTNAKTAMKWLTSASFDDSAIAKHFVAVTANKANAIALGIAESCIFDMWDWVGGRFSLWSAIGLPIAIDLGYDRFAELLEGAHAMDNHFLETELASNAPVILALLSVWNCTFLGAQSQAILPYDQSLHMLSAYLQQAEMESNGKSVTWAGQEVDYPTVPSIWGELGINGQHAFYQYLHQSNNIVPADFIGSVESHTPISNHHNTLMANFFAQTQALMEGVNEAQVREDLAAKGRTQSFIDKVAPHKVHKGNRPTNAILMKKLTPHTLGSLIALYEHKIFVQGVILQICSFDQWGVELGKGLAQKIEKELNSAKSESENDGSTAGLIDYFKRYSQ